VSPIRVQFNYDIVRPRDSATIATGHTVHATLDHAGRPRRLPERVHALLESPGGAPSAMPPRKRTSPPRRETSSSGVPRAVQE
jgi:hypothetical protein